MLGPVRDIGTCEVYYNGAKIGQYFGPLMFRYSQEDADVFESRYGNTPVDSVVVGSGPCEITVPFTRLSLADLATVLPGGSRSAHGSTSGNVEVVARDQIGRSEYDNAAELILKPYVDGVVNATNDDDWWLHIRKAYPRADYEITYDTSSQRIFNTIFKGFPDQITGVTWHIGHL